MNTKLWLILVAYCWACGLVYVSWGRILAGGGRRSCPGRRGPIREFIDEQAKTRLPQTYLITMPITGRIEAISPGRRRPGEAGEVVAQIVPRDLELAVDQAQAAVQRLDASIHENADVNVEETAYRQALQFVNSTGPRSRPPPSE